MSSVKIEIDNCLKCPHHESDYDPDPDDSFNRDDMYCACTLKPIKPKDPNSRYTHDRIPYKIVTCMDRPYQLKKNCDIPDWCPLRKK